MTLATCRTVTPRPSEHAVRWQQQWRQKPQKMWRGVSQGPETLCSHRQLLSNYIRVSIQVTNLPKGPHAIKTWSKYVNIHTWCLAVSTRLQCSTSTTNLDHVQSAISTVCKYRDELDGDALELECLNCIPNWGSLHHDSNIQSNRE